MLGISNKNEHLKRHAIFAFWYFVIHVVPIGTISIERVKMLKEIEQFGRYIYVALAL